MLKNDERSDYIWENAVDGRILLSNSFCEEFQDQSLEALAKKTFETVDQFKSLKKAYVTFHHREAYRFEGSGIVDGMKVSLRLLNTRRNGCYFDFVAITPTSDPQKDDSTFEEFLNAVVFKWYGELSSNILPVSPSKTQKEKNLRLTIKKVSMIKLTQSTEFIKTPTL